MKGEGGVENIKRLRDWEKGISEEDTEPIVSKHCR